MKLSLSTSSPCDRYVNEAGTFLNKLHFPSCSQSRDTTPEMLTIATHIVHTSIEHGLITGGFGVKLDEEDIQNRINKDVEAFVEFQQFQKRRQAQTVKGAAQNLYLYCKISKNIIDQYAQFLGYRLTWENKNITDITPLTHTS